MPLFSFKRGVLKLIYIPVDIKEPIVGKPNVRIQKGLTNNFPELIFELHDGCKYLDLGDTVSLYASITNTDLESSVFTGELRVLNPHRGQILCRLKYDDFTQTGLNTLTVFCNTGDFDVSFQKTIFVESVNESILKIFERSNSS